MRARKLPSEFFNNLLILLCHEFSMAAGTSWELRGKSAGQVDAQGRDGVRHVALRPGGKRLEGGSRRVGEVFGRFRLVGLRGESGFSQRPGSHKLRCTRWRGDGTRAILDPRSALTRSPA